MLKTKISKEEVNLLPVIVFEGKITLVDDLSKIHPAIEELRKSEVVGIDTETNTVYSGQKDNHPGLNKWALKIETDEMHWINPLHQLNIGDVKEFDIRIRYRQQLQKGTLTRLEDGFYILFNEKQRGITPGQFAALYLEDELIASGIISH